MTRIIFGLSRIKYYQQLDYSLLLRNYLLVEKFLTYFMIAFPLTYYLHATSIVKSFRIIWLN